MDSSTRQPRPWATALFGLFFLSGISGLMYQVVWVRMLTRILGSTSYAMATVLGVFMGGLALGSWIAGRFVDRLEKPLKAYAYLEIAVAAAALLSLALPAQLIPLYRSIYHAADGSRSVLLTGQVLVAVLVLLLPTMLMGATLPTLCAFGSRRSSEFRRLVSTLYSVNTLGALVGTLSAGFVLLGCIGETNTIFFGAALNIMVAALAWQLSSQEETSDSAHRTAAESSLQSHLPVATKRAPATSVWVRRAVLFTFAANGFISLAHEVIWGRMLVLYQGTSIYAFSSMLAVVLGGIGLGSLWMGRRVESLVDPLRTYARVQILAAVAALVGLHMYGLLGHLPQPSFLEGSNLKVLLVAPVLLLGPLALLWGAGFPLAARCYSQHAARAGRDISELYAWNTLGSILGAFAGGFWLMSTWGVSQSAIGLAVVAGVVGGLLLLVDAYRRNIGVAPPSKSLRFSVAMLVAVVALAVSAGDPYYRLIEARMKRRVAANTEAPLELYRHTESATGTTTAFGPYQQLWVNGEGMTHLCVETKLMAHLPWALSDKPVEDKPRDVCVICCGMGTSLKSAVVHEDARAWVVELLPDVFDTVQYFHPDQPDLLKNERITTVADDGRNYLMMNDRNYDVITVDPAPPFYSAGTVNLYTREFFDLAKSRLTDGGVFCLWIPPWEKGEIAYVMKTYTDVFEHVSVWSGPGSGGFPKGFYMLGRRTPFVDETARIRELYRNADVVTDLQQWDNIVDEADELLALKLTDGDELRQMLCCVPVMTDDRPYTEFPLFRSLTARKPDIFTGNALQVQLAEWRARKGDTVVQGTPEGSR